MNNFNIVFTAIKEQCWELGVLNEACYGELERIAENNGSFLALNIYLEVLQDLGLIKFCAYTHGIMLTEKGRKTEKLFMFEKNSAG